MPLARTPKKTSNPVLEFLSMVFGGDDPAQSAMDLANPLAPMLGMAKHGDNIIDLAKVLKERKELKQMAQFEKIREKLVAPRERFPISDVVKTALRQEDNLGFDSVGQAAGAIMREPNWKNLWDVNPDLIPIIEKWKDQALKDGPIFY